MTREDRFPAAAIGGQPDLRHGPHTLDPDLALGFRFLGRPVRVKFVAANTQTEVLHGATEVPDGVLVLSASGAVTRPPGVQWTKSLAFLRSSVANDETLLQFVVLKEEPLNVSPT